GLKRYAETPGRRHHLDPITDREALLRPGGEQTAFCLLDRDAQLAVVQSRTDRVGPSHLLAIQCGPQRQILTGAEFVVAGALRWHRERDGDRIGGLTPHVCDSEPMKMWGGVAWRLRCR